MCRTRNNLCGRWLIFQQIYSRPIINNNLLCSDFHLDSVELGNTQMLNVLQAYNRASQHNDITTTIVSHDNDIIPQRYHTTKISHHKDITQACKRLSQLQRYHSTRISQHKYINPQIYHTTRISHHKDITPQRYHTSLQEIIITTKISQHTSITPQIYHTTKISHHKDIILQ